jgi:hypothetical protein
MTAQRLGLQELAFSDIQGATPQVLKEIIPLGWICRHEPYQIVVNRMTEQGPVTQIVHCDQWKFTSPDGAQELRVHGRDPRFKGAAFIARWGIRYTRQKSLRRYEKRRDKNGEFVYIGPNPRNAHEKWIYCNSRGEIAPYRSAESHIPLCDMTEAEFQVQMSRAFPEVTRYRMHLEQSRTQ